MAISIIIVISILGSAVYVSYQQEKEKEGKINIVTSFYPLAYFSEQIGGDKVYVEKLVPDNSEIHTWEPAPQQILSADEADILVYNGAELDIWFEDDILPAIDKSGKIIVESTSGIELLEEEEEREGEEHEEEEHGHEHGLHDPHTWISPFLAMQQAENIYEAIIQEDPDNEEYYTSNWNELKQKFEKLDNDYKSALANKTKDMIFVTHSAYGYLAERYGFEQEGVIGLSADEQPSTSTIAGIVEDMKDEEIYVIYVDPIYSDDYAETLKNELERQTGEPVKILNLYFMIGKIDGMDYFDQQNKNLENLKTGLGVN